MTDSAHFLVEEGPDKGRNITLSSNDVRIGRSSNNDVVIRDPVMSRFHCRVSFKPDDGMWALDLGSSNQTLINDVSFQEQRIHPGDRLTMGDTVLKVLSDHQPGPSSDKSPTKLFDSYSSGNEKPGSAAKSRIDIKKKSSVFWRFLAILLLVLALLTAVTGIFWIQQQPVQGVKQAPVSYLKLPLAIEYEKISASPENILRYDLSVVDDTLCVQIDDIKNNKHVAGTQNREIEPELIRGLKESVIDGEFFDLKPEYRGIAQDVWDVWDLSVTIGRKTHRVKVVNCIAPPAFKQVCEQIEEFAQNELGLSALSLSPEELLAMAQESLYLGRNLYDQKEIKHENLFLSIEALKKAEWYLETIEPKPDFYPDIVSLRSKAEEELDEQCDNHEFLVNRAVRLKNWEEAARELRIMRERIPNRSDPRHKNAVKRLIDVERRVK